MMRCCPEFGMCCAVLCSAMLCCAGSRTWQDDLPLDNSCGCVICLQHLQGQTEAEKPEASRSKRRQAGRYTVMTMAACDWHCLVMVRGLCQPHTATNVPTHK
jgi:hypothetical protein